ncbi:rRNA pseudouridine synthase [Candidatus Dependentiae bacterium]|nr:rRNA pseudouridine synthase [Candidatus Dependentiae bacterium]
MKKTPQSLGTQLNKYIAHAGLCSRRKAELLIEKGDISVNGKAMLNSGYRVQPGDVVKYVSQIIKPEHKMYILLNKPKGYITTVSDDRDRKTVMSLVELDTKERIYPVGRLDRATTGLLLMTNDGELAQQLAHPRNRVRKIYHVQLDRPLTTEHYHTIKDGFKLEDGSVKVDAVSAINGDPHHIALELHSGKNHIVRRIFEHFDYKIAKLDRVMYAGLTKKKLPQGQWRFLTDYEVDTLYNLSPEHRTPENKTGI